MKKFEYNFLFSLIYSFSCSTNMCQNVGIFRSVFQHVVVTSKPFFLIFFPQELAKKKEIKYDIYHFFLGDKLPQINSRLFICCGRVYVGTFWVIKLEYIIIILNISVSFKISITLYFEMTVYIENKIQQGDY